MITVYGIHVLATAASVSSFRRFFLRSSTTPLSPLRRRRDCTLEMFAATLSLVGDHRVHLVVTSGIAETQAFMSAGSFG